MNKKINSKGNKGKSTVPYLRVRGSKSTSEKTMAEVLKRLARMRALSASKSGYAVVKIEVEKPVVKKWGNNRLEITPIETIIPQAYDVSPRLKEYQPSKQVVRIANILIKSRIKSLQRVGNDLIEL